MPQPGVGWPSTDPARTAAAYAPAYVSAYVSSGTIRALSCDDG
ncbi:hypothetical protein ACWGAN_04400 [Streptomyces sp. NPDC054945]